MDHSGKKKFASEPRIACAMWDFSWLTRRYGERNEYEDWDKVLDELVFRGYNCIRLDVFPHLIAKDRNGNSQEEFTLNPDKNVIQWGNNIPVTVRPKQSLVEFFKKATERNIRLGLSTWLNQDDTNRKAMLATPEDYFRVWHETLSFIEQHGFLDSVEWVDLTNEWPIGIWGGYYYPEIFDRPRPDTLIGQVLPIVKPWSEETSINISSFISASINALKESWPTLSFTYSSAGILSKKIKSLDLSGMDLLEPHIWLSDSVSYSIQSGAGLATLQLPMGLKVFHSRGAKVFEKNKVRWISILGEQMDNWVDIAKENDIALYTTEAWACTVYDDKFPTGSGAEWNWLKEVNRAGVEMAIDKGWIGICSSNFCQPHFKGMWADTGWHKEITGIILG